MTLIEKRKLSGFWNKKSPKSVTITLDKSETNSLIQEKSIVIDRDFGRFKISIPPLHDGDITPDIIEIDQLPRALK